MLSVQCEPPQVAQAQNINAGTVGEKNDRYRKKKKYYNNNGNFICVFECTIVNLATCRQFKNAAWDWIIKEKKTKTETETKQNKIQKKFKIALILGYPSSYFYNKRCNMLL